MTSIDSFDQPAVSPPEVPPLETDGTVVESIWCDNVYVRQRFLSNIDLYSITRCFDNTRTSGQDIYTSISTCFDAEFNITWYSERNDGCGTTLAGVFNEYAAGSPNFMQCDCSSAEMQDACMMCNLVNQLNSVLPTFGMADPLPFPIDYFKCSKSGIMATTFFLDPVANCADKTIQGYLNCFGAMFASETRKGCTDCLLTNFEKLIPICRTICDRTDPSINMQLDSTCSFCYYMVAGISSAVCSSQVPYSVAIPAPKLLLLSQILMNSAHLV